MSAYEVIKKNILSNRYMRKAREKQEKPREKREKHREKRREKRRRIVFL